MPEPTRWRKRPVVIEAMQWTGDNADELAEWTDGAFHDKPCGGAAGTGCLYVAANSSHLGIPTGEWVIRDRAGFYPCRADVLAATYEPASAPPDADDPAELRRAASLIHAVIEAGDGAPGGDPHLPKAWQHLRDRAQEIDLAAAREANPKESRHE